MDNNTEIKPIKRKDSVDIKRILVGVAGGSASGKTTMCNNVRKEMTYDGEFKVLIVPLDCFYKGVDKQRIDPRDYNFDHPDALDFDAAYECLSNLMEGNKTEIPRYNFVTHSQEEEKDLVDPTDVILFEGILALYDQRIRDLMEYKIFMHCDDDLRLCRRLLRDVRERGREVEGVLFQYNRFVKRSFDEYIRPTMNYADMIVPGNRNNMVSVQFIVQYLKTKSKFMGIYRDTVKKQLVFFGDMIETFENQLSQKQTTTESYQTTEDFTFKKFLIFPNTEALKREVSNMFAPLTENFNTKKCSSIFRDLIKLTMRLWQNIAQIDKIKYEDMQAFDISELYEAQGDGHEEEKYKEIKEKYAQNNLKKYVLIQVPILLPENEQKILNIFKWFQDNQPNSQLVLLSLFSSLSVLTKVRENCPNVIHALNVLCVANRDKFMQTLQENYIQEPNVKQKLWDPTFLHEKLYKRIKKIIKKRNAQLLLEAKQQQEDKQQQEAEAKQKQEANQQQENKEQDIKLQKDSIQLKEDNNITK